MSELRRPYELLRRRRASSTRLGQCVKFTKRAARAPQRLVRAAPRRERERKAPRDAGRRDRRRRRRLEKHSPKKMATTTVSLGHIKA